MIYALGGLTNIATAILMDSGSAIPSFNMLADPEAAHIVFTSARR